MGVSGGVSLVFSSPGKGVGVLRDKSLYELLLRKNERKAMAALRGFFAEIKKSIGLLGIL